MMIKKVSFMMMCGVLLVGGVSCTSTDNPNRRNTAEAYNRQQAHDHRQPVPLSDDPSSPWHSVRGKSDGVALNAVTF